MAIQLTTCLPQPKCPQAVCISAAVPCSLIASLMHGLFLAEVRLIRPRRSASTRCNSERTKKSSCNIHCVFEKDRYTPQLLFLPLNYILTRPSSAHHHVSSVGGLFSIMRLCFNISMAAVLAYHRCALELVMLHPAHAKPCTYTCPSKHVDVNAQ